jgi:hypothetical protein
MGHFAKVIDGIVQEVIVAEQDFIDSGAVGNSENWIQTSYNTYGGVHKLGGTPLRKNFPSAGFIYDKTIDAFIPPQPLEYKSWVLNKDTCLWEAPIKMPKDGNAYYWDESILNWVKLDIDENGIIKQIVPTK